MQRGAARIVTFFGAFESTLENTPGLDRHTSGRQRFLMPWLKRVSRNEALSASSRLALLFRWFWSRLPVLILHFAS